MVLALADEVMGVELDMLRSLVQRVVESAWIGSRALGAVKPKGPALPFFDAVTMAPPDGLEGARGKDDPLAWYAAFKP